MDEKKWELWTGNHPRSTLGETVMRFVERKLTHTEEFQTMLKVFGRDRLHKAYEAELEKRDQLQKELSNASASGTLQREGM